MNPNQRTFQLNLSKRWQQASIRTKLLLPIILGLGVILVAMLFGVQRPIDTLADNAVREAFSHHSQLLEDSSVELLAEYQRVIADLSANSTLTDAASQLGISGNNPDTRATLTESITTVLQNFLKATRQPFAGLRLLSADGQQITFLSTTQAGQSAPSAQFTPRTTADLISEGKLSYFPEILLRPALQGYLLPLKLR